VKKILIAEDDIDIREIIEFNLQNAGYSTIPVKNGHEVLEQINKMPDLILLDINMPGLNGFEVCTKIRKNTKFDEIPIIFITARDEEIDELRGLSLGANDYITKPFSPAKILARIKTHLRKAKDPNQNSISFTTEDGILEINEEKYIVVVNNEKYDLPKKEFDLLYYLAKNMGRVFDRENILNNVWGLNVYVSDRTIDVHIRRIRKRLGIFGKYIETIKGVGYKFSQI
jgi:DNA-binding response OmpR family regulator